MTLVDKIFILKSIHPFDILYDKELILLANVIDVRNYKAGEIIYDKENYLSRLYIIAEGIVKSENGESIENYFGLEMLSDEKSIEHNIVAHSDVTMLLISQEHLLTILYESPRLVIGFLKSQTEEDNED
ncbi:MAG: Crp/Fnr family transcriptional regulator [Campylobacterales bacterium]|nr:Crp/Fnr family transcriptional regulator [Campylobacterales bacterium]